MSADSPSSQVSCTPYSSSLACCDGMRTSLLRGASQGWASSGSMRGAVPDSLASTRWLICSCTSAALMSPAVMNTACDGW